MAFYIDIKKVSEDQEFVYYKYSGAPNKKYGLLKINKSNADVHVLEYAEDDEAGEHSKRACLKLMQHWRKGEYPAHTCWAS